MTQEQAQHQADLWISMLRDDREQRAVGHAPVLEDEREDRKEREQRREPYRPEGDPTHRSRWLGPELPY